MRTRTCGQIVVSLCLLSSPASLAVGQPVRWEIADGGNGHYYEVVENRVDWAVARDDAAARSFEGFPGHLATITSTAENDAD